MKRSERGLPLFSPSCFLIIYLFSDLNKMPIPDLAMSGLLKSFSALNLTLRCDWSCYFIYLFIWSCYFKNLISAFLSLNLF